MEENRRLSRRAVMKSVALLASTTVIAGLMESKDALAQKASKASMQYQDKPSGDKQCSNCAQFIPANSCQIVEGTINPQGFCISWQKKS